MAVQLVVSLEPRHRSHLVLVDERPGGQVLGACGHRGVTATMTSETCRTRMVTPQMVQLTSGAVMVSRQAIRCSVKIWWQGAQQPAVAAPESEAQGCRVAAAVPPHLALGFAVKVDAFDDGRFERGDGHQGCSVQVVVQWCPCSQWKWTTRVR